MPTDECKWHEERLDSAIDDYATGKDTDGIFVAAAIRCIESDITELRRAVTEHDRASSDTADGSVIRAAAARWSDGDPRSDLSQEIEDLGDLVVKGNAAMRTGARGVFGAR